jgi:hypothetical protein
MTGDPLADAAGAVFNQLSSVIGNGVPELRLIFRRGAFDLARRLNEDLRTESGGGYSTPQGSNVQGGAARGFHPRLLIFGLFGAAELVAQSPWCRDSAVLPQAIFVCAY